MAYAAYYRYMKTSQAKQPTPTPAVPVSTVKPAEYEMGSASASAAGSAAKPGTTAPSAATTAASTAPTSTAATVSAGVSAGAKVSGGVSTGASVSGAPPTGAASNLSTQSGASKVSPQVQVEVPPPATKNSAPAPAVDPFDALAGSLPSSEPVAPKGPQYTGPEIKEPSLISEEAKRCGENEHTLPPGYRKEDMEKKMPAGKPDKPKEVSKPLTEDDALLSLSAGFVSSAVPSAPKSQAVHAESAPPAAKASVPAPAVDPFNALAGRLPSSEPVAPKAPQYFGPEVIEPAIISEVAFCCGENEGTYPPGYRWKDMEKKVPAGVSDKPKEVSKRQDVTVPTNVSPAPPADKKARVEKSANDSVKAAPSSSPAGKPKTDEGDPMSLDALSALEDTLPVAKPAPKSPKLRPEDIVDEKKAKAEKGVRVGEREDTLPPDYRFSEEKHKERPAPPKEPSMDSAEALDILSGDFTSPLAAPAVQAPVPPSAPAKQQPKVEDLSALEQLAGDFVAPAQAKKVASVAPPPAAKNTVGPTSDEGDPMSLDALSALGDTLPTAKPVAKSPKLRPEDIIDEKKLSSEKGVRVGERDDTLPPDYRFSEEASKKYPAPPKEPSLDSAEALDILSGGFTSNFTAPAVQAPVPPSAPPADSSADFALEELAGDFVAPTAASKVHSAVTTPPKPDRQLSENTASAMDALSDTLKDIAPAPQPVPVAPKDIVKEKQAVEEKITKAGERDDTLPPDYRPTEADLKAAAEAKAKAKANVPPKQTSMDELAALDALSSDFSGPLAAAPAAPVVPPSSHPHAPPAKTPPTHSAPAASGTVLDKLATTLLPDLPETKPKDSKPKKPAVEDAPTSGHLSGQPSTDVVSTSPTKKGGKS
ncbi:hypothetical protein MHYP_G00209740 [Metynnis hypsauchen]